MTVAHQSDAIEDCENRQQERTPLPKFQLFIIFLIQFAEPITATVIAPFVNQFVRDTGVIRGDERRTGYYAGIIGSAFFFSEALTVFHWGRISDWVGRRPVLLLGPIGLSFAMLSFGLSTSFWSMLASRCVQGVFNGNIGVSKVVLAEITDSTNIGDAFAMVSLVWSFGSSIGPILGGILSQPATRWPFLFGKISLFRDHPYFLPCAAASLLAFASGAIAFISLKETLPSAVAQQKIDGQMNSSVEAAKSNTDSTTRLLEDHDSVDYGSSEGSNVSRESRRRSSSTILDTEQPPPFKALLTPQVIITLSVYTFLAFVDMSSQILLPLVYSTSIPLGGLGFDAYQIGVILGVWGVINVIVQLSFLGNLIRRFGPTKVHIFSQCSYVWNIGLYPLLSFLVKRSGRVDAKVWTVMIVQLALRLTNNMAYGSIQVLIVDVAPNRASLGATNGLAQALGCVGRSIAPAAISAFTAEEATITPKGPAYKQPHAHY
ncbi:Protein ZINC INDUCED FACILITATOR-LIKE 1 [Hypsizygus marmoreus]|uniref:Protein ZINC INDUCED FACILITATOR-LIKE 1 n=1 Tax=Hypsizygus marmoreus TaxID=39966 RepID=A0A369JVR0_HYPMA|nr:Protein ZINC INDUCED FACILITATOR-LIKE 1 [Hypsizygus marmoreus]